MRRHRCGFQLAMRLVIVCALAGCTRAPDSPRPLGTTTWSSAWVPFDSSEGKFRVSFPGRPTRTVSSDGREVRFSTPSTSGRCLLRASYDEKANTNLPLQARFDAVAKLPKVKQMTPSVEVLTGPHKGLEARYEMHSEDAVRLVRHRVYHVGETLYQVMVLAERGAEAEADFDKFFASFEILDP